MDFSADSTILLPKSNVRLPIVGFGVYQSTSALASVTEALEQGYSHIDSARCYRNEAEVGEAVQRWRKSGATDQVFLTSKVTSKEYGTKKTDLAVDSSIDRLQKHGLTWDLYLLHDPTSGPARRLEAWKVLERKVAEGKLNAIGVSNFSDVHLEEFVNAGVSQPEVNQIELHPFCQQKPIVEYCKRKGIVIEAYSPLVRGTRFDDPVLQSVSKDVRRTPAQVLVRWSLQKGYVPLPKSDTPSRIQENFQVFDFHLSPQQMNLLDSLDEGSAGACTWNPVNHV